MSNDGHRVYLTDEDRENGWRDMVRRREEMEGRMPPREVCRQIREAAGMSELDYGRWGGDSAAVVAWEEGHTSLSASQLSRLAEFYKAAAVQARQNQVKAQEARSAQERAQAEREHYFRTYGMTDPQTGQPYEPPAAPQGEKKTYTAEEVAAYLDSIGVSVY